MAATAAAISCATGPERQAAALFGASAVLSNIVANVPATIANIIVVTGARALGVDIGFRTHLRTGAPVTLATLASAACWLALRN